MKKSLYFLVVGLIILLSACTTQTETTDTSDSLDSVKVDTVQVDTVVAEPQVLIEKDTVLDNLARFIAGLPQLDTNSFSVLEQDKYWVDFKKSMDTNWDKMYNTRLSKMEKWEKEHLSLSKSDSLTLFYPFSGPDFLHAHYLFPHANEFVLAALEPIKEIVPLDTVSVSDRDKFLDSLGISLRDIFQKSYFITTHMQEDLKQIKGVLPPLYFFLERSGHEILTQKFITLDSAGAEVDIAARKLHWNKIPGVKLTFRVRDSDEVKTLFYFSISISNGGLKERPEFVKFITTRAPFNTFVKSASYLMHRDAFTGIRDLIIQNSQALFQDDTGIPYRNFKNKLNWNGTFYGEYTKPVKDFEEALFQKDLDSAYKAAPKNALPFSLGYHWGSAKQNYMLFTKVPAPQQK